MTAAGHACEGSRPGDWCLICGATTVRVRPPPWHPGPTGIGPFATHVAQRGTVRILLPPRRAAEYEGDEPRCDSAWLWTLHPDDVIALGGPDPDEVTLYVCDHQIDVD